MEPVKSLPFGLAPVSSKLLLILVASAFGWSSRGDDFVGAPAPTGPRGGPTETGTIYPFLIKQMGSPPTPTMRYQQVCNASLFTNINPASIYVTTLKFGLNNNTFIWTVPSMQVDLSTTAKSADTLSRIFSENVGPDDTVVFGPGNCSFPGGGYYDSPQEILLTRPFIYDPARGNLLMDIRVFDGSGPPDPFNPHPLLFAITSPTDTVSRVWATNVNAAAADGVDSVGLFTIIQLSPVPSLTVQFYPTYAGTQSNIVVIGWPSQPSTFTLQMTDRPGDSTSWHAVTNQILGSPSDPVHYIIFPAASAGRTGYYRLVWPGGY